MVYPGGPFFIAGMAKNGTFDGNMIAEKRRKKNNVSCDYFEN